MRLAANANAIGDPKHYAEQCATGREPGDERISAMRKRSKGGELHERVPTCHCDDRDQAKRAQAFDEFQRLAFQH